MSYKFDLGYQEHILASIIGDEQFLKANLEVLHPDFFNDDILKGIAEASLEFYKREKELPSREALLQELKETDIYIAPGREFREYAQGVENVFDKFGVNAAYYQGKAVEFAKKQAVSAALDQSIGHLESGNIEEIVKSIGEAVKVGEGLTDQKVYDYLQECKERAIEYSKPGAGNIDRLGTGFDSLDQLMQGGLGLGELGVIVALPKHGKTTTLINIAYNALLRGKTVNYFTLELSRKMIAARMDVRIFGRDIGKIKKMPRSFYKKLKEVRDSVEGKLKILEFPTKSLSINRVESILQKIGVGDVTIIDYAQLLKTSTARAERRNEITDIYENLRRMAGELPTRVWTAHQANRTGVSSKLIQADHIAEDFNIIAIADLGVSFNQTDQERRMGRGRFYIMGSRIGPSGDIIHCDVDWQKAKIVPSVDEEEEFE